MSRQQEAAYQSHAYPDSHETEVRMYVDPLSVHLSYVYLHIHVWTLLVNNARILQFN